MSGGDDKQWKCFEYICPKFPKCERAVGSCCAVGDFFEDVTLSKEQCFDLPDKPFFREKVNKLSKRGYY